MSHRPSPEPRILDDPRSMRALAHPVRMALLEQLTLRGPMTATQCAELVDESPSSCSFHLRTLARYGFVEEDPDVERAGRQRPWRVVAIGSRFDTGPGTPPAVRHAGEALARIVRERDREALEAHLARRDEFGPEWDDAVVHANYGGYLTPGEMREIGERIYALWQPYLARLADPGARPEGARLVHMFVHGFPRADGLSDEPGPAVAAADHDDDGADSAEGAVDDA